MARASGEIFGYIEITHQYHQRYCLPVMHTETNLSQGPLGTEAVDWLWKQWANVLRVRNDGVLVFADGSDALGQRAAGEARQR